MTVSTLATPTGRGWRRRRGGQRVGPRARLRVPDAARLAGPSMVRGPSGQEQKLDWEPHRVDLRVVLVPVLRGRAVCFAVKFAFRAAVAGIALVSLRAPPSHLLSPTSHLSFGRKFANE